MGKKPRADQAHEAQAFWQQEMDLSCSGTNGIRDPPDSSRCAKKTRLVDDCGFFIFTGKKYFIGIKFAGLCIGISVIDSRRIGLWFEGTMIGFLNFDTDLLEFRIGRTIERGTADGT